MKIVPIRSNVTELHLNSGVVILFSYQTPVAAFVPGKGYLVTSKKFSATTSRHISQWLARTEAWEVPHNEIEALAD